MRQRVVNNRRQPSAAGHIQLSAVCSTVGEILSVMRQTEPLEVKMFQSRGPTVENERSVEGQHVVDSTTATVQLDHFMPPFPWMKPPKYSNFDPFAQQLYF